MPYRACVPALALWLLSGAAWASGIPGHIYAATRMLETCPALAAEVGPETAAYLAGAAGPDIAFVAADPADRAAPGAEAHYDRTGALCLALLTEARSPAERAFALGWVTHWLTDAHIHTLVNAYGGLWDDPSCRHRHSLLEAVETKHVYTIRDRVPGLRVLTVDAGQVPSALVARAFSATYHKAAFEPGADGVAPFERLLRPAALFIDGSARFYREACENGTGQASDPVMEVALATFRCSVPSTAQYEALVRALSLEAMSANDAGVRGRLTIGDLGLYGKFLRDWQVVMDSLAATAPAVLAPCVALARDPQSPSATQAARAALPDIDLDNPVRSAASAAAAHRVVAQTVWDLLNDGTLRGDPRPQEITLYGQIHDGPVQLLGALPLAGLAQTGFDGSRQGAGDISQPIRNATAPGTRVRLYATLGGPAGLAHPEYAGLEYAVGAVGDEPGTETGLGRWVLVSDEADGPDRWEGYDNQFWEVTPQGNTVTGSCRLQPEDAKELRSVVVEGRFRHHWTELPEQARPGERLLVTLTASCEGTTVTGNRPELAETYFATTTLTVLPHYEADPANRGFQPQRDLGRAFVTYGKGNRDDDEPTVTADWRFPHVRPEATSDEELTVVLRIDCTNHHRVYTYRYEPAGQP